MKPSPFSTLYHFELHTIAQQFPSSRSRSFFHMYFIQFFSAAMQTYIKCNLFVCGRLFAHKVSVYCRKCVHSWSPAHLGYIGREGKAPASWKIYFPGLFRDFPRAQLYAARQTAHGQYRCKKYHVCGRRNFYRIFSQDVFRLNGSLATFFGQSVVGKMS